MPRPGPTTLSRPAMLALATLVWFASPLGATSAKAAGCHVPERPVLGMNATGPADDHAWTMADGVVVAPPVLTRVPCPGETPHGVSRTMAPVGIACLSVVGGGPCDPLRVRPRC